MALGAVRTLGSHPRGPVWTMRLPKREHLLVLPLLALATAGNADEGVLYCTEKHVIGMQGSVEGAPASKEEWEPAYGGEEFGGRYAIRFNEGWTEMSGVQGGDTTYRCDKLFPNKAPDLVSCVNPLVRTMIFNYSTENRHFLFSSISPGGWLGIDTVREEGLEAYADQIVMGECQDF